MVMSISILLVNLLTSFITDYFLSYKYTFNPLKFTAIGMLVLIAVFYPAFEYFDRIVERFAAKLLLHGKNVFGRFMGVLLVYIFIMFILFCIYANLWFHVDVFRMLIHYIF